MVQLAVQYCRSYSVVWLHHGSKSYPATLLTFICSQLGFSICVDNAYACISLNTRWSSFFILTWHWPANVMYKRCMMTEIVLDTYPIHQWQIPCSGGPRVPSGQRVVKPHFSGVETSAFALRMYLEAFWRFMVQVADPVALQLHRRKAADRVRSHNEETVISSLVVCRRRDYSPAPCCLIILEALVKNTVSPLYWDGRRQCHILKTQL